MASQAQKWRKQAINEASQLVRDWLKTKEGTPGDYTIDYSNGPQFAWIVPGLVTIDSREIPVSLSECGHICMAVSASRVNYLTGRERHLGTTYMPFRLTDSTVSNQMLSVLIQALRSDLGITDD